MTDESNVTGLKRRPTRDQIEDALTIWDYHQMRHDLRPVDIGIGLGSHDLGVATFAAQLYQQGLFPTLVFTGANSPTSASRFLAVRRSTTASAPLSSAYHPPLFPSSRRQPIPARTSHSPATCWREPENPSSRCS
jgi:hypothetical protein